MLGALRALGSRVAAPAALATRAVGKGAGRRTWTTEGRTHIEVLGTRTESANERITTALEQLPGVKWAEINAALGMVVVAHDDALIGCAELISTVEESEPAADHESRTSLPYPGSPVRMLDNAVVMSANLAGLGYALLARSLAVPALPPSVPAVVSTADAAQRVRGAIRARLGHVATDCLFGLSAAMANTLAQRPASLLTDASQRFCLLRESQAASRSWTRWESGLGDRPEAHRCEPFETEPRSAPLPDGPVERTARTSTMAGPAAFLASLGLTSNIQRAQGFLVAGVPRAGALGREAFAAQLGVGISGRDVLVLDPDALRRLDRIDTVVLDASVLRTGNWLVREVMPLDPEADIAKMWERAHLLITAGRGAERDGWALLPVSPEQLPAKLRDKIDGQNVGVRAFALARHAHHAAMILVEEERDPLADELLTAARAVGTVVLAGHGAAPEDQVDRVVPAGQPLAAVVRGLQAEGRAVAVMSAHERAGLAAADIGIGVVRSGAPPWGAHVIAGPGLGESCVLLKQVPTARMVSRRCAQFGAMGSAAGAVLAVLGPATGSQGRAAVPVTTCAALALGAGTWWGMQAACQHVPRTVARTPWHAMSSSTVLELLNSSSDGLSGEEARHRARERLRYAVRSRTSLVYASLEELASPLTPALLGGAGISASIGAVADAAIITAVLGLNALIGGVQRISADRALQQLMDASSIQVTARRDGELSQVVADELVAGDVIELAAGDSVPADCRVLCGDGLEVDESSLTGESNLVPKSIGATPGAGVADRSCILYQGTAVAAGKAVAVVVATGAGTEAGSAREGGETHDRTHGVAVRLRELAELTVPISVGSGVLLLVADLLRRQPFGVALGRAVSLAVAAVPEGLPFVATVAELAAARRLSWRGALVHDSSTIEALGRAEVLCFDKTGTLTEGRITMRGVSDGISSCSIDDMSTRERKILAAALRASPLAGDGEVLPHPTDRAVVEGGLRAGVQPTEGAEGWQLVEELPFEPSRGYHIVLGRLGTEHLLSIKGAPEVVLAQCTHWSGPVGDQPLDEVDRLSVNKEFEGLARQGFRVLAVAERAASGRRDLDETRVRSLRLVGLIALADPVRPTAAAAVDQLQRAGVQVVMVTGDHPSTAEAIAAELNVLNGHRVMTGLELDSLDDEEFAAEVSDIAVFARVSPGQKARIVGALQSAGRVVAVTGDGANDAPAIRLADVGIALGEHATPAAREAADVVVTDNRIETTVDAIVEGRAMWASVRDSLALLLGGNLGEVGFTVLTGLLSPGGSINARQMLLINLLTDVLPAMAIAVRPPPRVTTEMLLAEGPDASLGPALVRDIYQRGIITGGAATLAWLLGRMTGTRGHANTVALVALVGAQLGQTLVVRGSTPLVAVSSLASMGALAAVVQIPGLSHFFGSTPLWPHGWAIALGCTVAASAVSVVLQPRTNGGRKALPPAGAEHVLTASAAD